MNFYDDLVMQTQMNYSRHYPIYASGSTPYQLTDKKPLPYSEQIHRLVQEVKEADCVVVGGCWCLGYEMIPFWREPSGRITCTATIDSCDAG